MNELDIMRLESRIDSINNAIAQMRKDATDTTHSTVEMAIEMLALPELAKVESQLVAMKQNIADFDKFLDNPIFTKRK